MWRGAVDIIDRSGLNYQLHAMGTNIEGELEQVLAVLQQCIEALSSDCNRVTVAAKLDCRKDHSGLLAGKPEAIEKLLGRTLKK